MKKILFPCLILLCYGTAIAQFDASQLSIGLNGNYTMYKGNFQKSTPGVQLRVGYEANEKMNGYLAFNYGFAIKSPSTINYTDDVNRESTIKFNFKTITLNVNYSIIGDFEESFSLYGGAGASYVMATYDETPKATPPAGVTATNQLAKTTESGFTINLNLGTQFRTGKLAPFFDAGISLPANQTNGVYVENVIPAHFVLNAGVRFFLGSDY